MDTPLIPSETETRALAFLQMGGEAGQTGKRYTQRCIALLNFLGRQSPLAGAMAIEFQRLHRELAAHEAAEAVTSQTLAAQTEQIANLQAQLVAGREAAEVDLAKTVDEWQTERTELLEEIQVHEQLEQRQALDAARAIDDFSLPHPFQPLTINNDGRVKFWSNSIVAWAVQHGPYQHAPFPAHFSMADREQLAQLLGMELDVFTAQPFVRRYTADAAGMMDMIPLPCPPPALQGQDIVVDEQSGVGFRGNALVRFLMAHSFLSQAQLEALPANAHDRTQFEQLMGKSLVGEGARYLANQAGDPNAMAA